MPGGPHLPRHQVLQHSCMVRGLITLCMSVPCCPGQTRGLAGGRDRQHAHTGEVHNTCPHIKSSSSMHRVWPGHCVHAGTLLCRSNQSLGRWTRSSTLSACCQTVASFGACPRIAMSRAWQPCQTTLYACLGSPRYVCVGRHQAYALRENMSGFCIC